MHTIKIFLASSSELTDWREAVGDAVRRWSDELEPKGFRILLNCWEDFYPEFNGIRKQEEYNEELIKDSNLFFAVFRTKCGVYTQEEISVAGKYLPKWRKILKHTNGVSAPAVDEYLSRERLPYVEVDSIERALDEIRGDIEKYCNQLPLSAPLNNPGPLLRKIVYGSVGTDISVGKIRLGNIVRQLDRMAEQELGLRCGFTTSAPRLLPQADYYIALLKDDLPDEVNVELSYAVCNSAPDSKPQVSVVYLCPGGKALNSNPGLKTMIETKGIYTTPLDSAYRIKYNLWIWLLSRKVLTFDEKTGLKISGGWIYYMDYKLIPESYLSLNGGSDEEKLMNLLANITTGLLCNTESVSEGEPIDFAKFDKSMKNTLNVQDMAVDMFEHSCDAIRKLLGNLNLRLRNLEVTENNFDEIFELISRKITLESRLLAYEKTDAVAPLRSLIFFIRLCDLFSEKAILHNYDEDAHFKMVCRIADTYSVSAPQIEAIRMNYANSLCRHHKNVEAMHEYHKALINLKKLDDGSRIMTRYLPALYLNYITAMAELGVNSEAYRLLQEFEQKISGWNEEDKLMLHPLVYRTLIAELRLKLFGEIPDTQKKEVIYHSRCLWEELVTVPSLYVPTRYWDDVYCYFPLCLASVILDFPEYVSSSGVSPQVLAIKILLKSKEILDANTHLEEKLRLNYLAQIYHNIAFASLSNSTARKYALKALEVREKLYALEPNETNEEGIAHTLLIVGATYINNRSKYLSAAYSREALKYADRCLRIRKQLCDTRFPGPITKLYEAKLLKGTILYFTKGRTEEGRVLLRECHEWNIANPDNSYYDVIESETRRLLTASDLSINSAQSHE